MIKLFKKLFSNPKFKELFLYGIFGVLATVIDIFVYWFCARILNFSTVTSTSLAWLIAVMFAYFSNHTFVFESGEKTFKGILREMIYFFSCRIATGIIDVVIMYVFVDLINFDGVYVKTVSNIIVIILNYIASKLFIFKKK